MAGSFDKTPEQETRCNIAEGGKQMVCIHCRQADGIEPVALTERGREVGMVYCCAGCRQGMQGYSIDIIFYNPEERGAEQTVH